MNYDQIERAFGAFLYRKGEGNSDREAFFKALDITSGGEAADVDPKRWREHIGNIDGLIYTEVVPEAPQPAQPDLEVVGHVRRDPNDTIPHEAAFQFSECAPGGFDDEGWRAVGYIDDAQAHIAALTAKIQELEGK